MRKASRSSSAYQAASREMIEKLVKAGYLEPARRLDPEAISAAIARMMQSLRRPPGDEGPDGRLQPGGVRSDQ
jgi:hypothetical protein